MDDDDHPETLEAIFKDFEGRRDAIFKALTADLGQFYEQCDPAKGNLCLYGYPDNRWQLTEPLEDIPSKIPEPALGINLARDHMDFEKWIVFVASRSDVWLLSVAFYQMSCVGVFGRTERERLFNMINELRTLREVTVTSYTDTKQSEESSNSSSKKPESNSKGKQPKVLELKNEEKEDDFVEQIFEDFKGRRAALSKAMTLDIQKLYDECHPAKENLCLYGYPDQRWEVTTPEEEIPTTIPEPALGINFARDGIDLLHWTALVAASSDAWLLSVAFYYMGVDGFGRTERKRLFNMINELPTLLEVIKGTAKKQSEGPSNSSSIQKPESNSKRKQATVSGLKIEEKEDVLVEEEEEQGDTPCGACHENYKPDEFWIFCDYCKTWYHGECVKITPEMAKHIKQYRCFICNYNYNYNCKRARS